jgi:hypothetical protein
MVGIKLISGFSLPASGALSLARVKEHLRVTGTDEDSLIAGYLWAAIHYIQDATGRALLTSTWRQTLDRFPRGYLSAANSSADGFPYGCDVAIRLLRSPVQSVSSIAYRDTAGITQTITTGNLLLESDCDPARVSPLNGAAWPTDISVRPGAVSVNFVAGNDLGADVPAHVVHAVYLLVGHWYENREAVVIGETANDLPTGVDALISMSRLPWLDYEVK